MEDLGQLYIMRKLVLVWEHCIPLDMEVPTEDYRNDRKLSGALNMLFLLYEQFYKTIDAENARKLRMTN